MSKPQDGINYSYGGIVIIYLEAENKWNCEIRGRERNFDSLAKAKEAIDRPAPEERSKAEFKRIPVLVAQGWGGHGEFFRGEVTSVADTSYGQQQVWVNYLDKQDSFARMRERVPVDRVFANTPENAALVKEIEYLKEKKAALDASINCTAKKLTQIKV